VPNVIAATYEGARLIFKVCQNMGFDPRIETANANRPGGGAIAGDDYLRRRVAEADLAAFGHYSSPGLQSLMSEARSALPGRSGPVYST
jgi:hypothetical protein